MIFIKISGYFEESSKLNFNYGFRNVKHGSTYVPINPKAPICVCHNTSLKLDGFDGLFWCVVHPDEHERMERILNGTDNPLYDLVHELRYNPNMPTHLGVERKEAQEDFEQKKKQKRELE